MDDRNRYPYQYNQFSALDYRHLQQPMQSFDMGHQDRRFPVNTNLPMYHTQIPAQNPGFNPAPIWDRPQNYNEDKPPPSYEESKYDRLLRRSKIGPSPAWNFGDGVERQREVSPKPPKTSFQSLFDIPGQSQPVKRSPDWSSNNYNSSQSFQEIRQQKINSFRPSSFSQQSTPGFSYGYERQSDNRFSRDNRGGFNEHNKNRGKGRGGFRGRGNYQNEGRPQDGRLLQGSCGPGKAFNTGSDDNFKDTIKQPTVEQRNDDDEENDEDGSNALMEKINPFYPDPTVVKKYEYYPPNLQEIGEMFKDLVIHFFYKSARNKKETNPFVVVCEAFRRSQGFCNLDVEDGYDVTCKYRKFCTLRYQGMMMVRGVGENDNLKEPRVRAGVELINNLAMSCYTIQSKHEYFSVEGLERMIARGSEPGVFMIVPEEDSKDLESARKFLSSREDTDVEYIFHLGSSVLLLQLKCWANLGKFACRLIKDGWLGICQNRTTQYWRDKILASGSMETARYILKPPQGIGNLLMPNYSPRKEIHNLKVKGQFYLAPSLPNLYGPPGTGPKISKALPPWNRRGGGPRNKNSRNKEKRIIGQLKEGIPLEETKGFSYLSKKRKKRLRQKLGGKNWN